LTKKNICCWDLEGPISTLDFAAEIGKLLSQKAELNLQKYDMSEFFSMISNYDDYLIDTPDIKKKLGIEDYEPGDTLRIMAPLYASSFSDDELIEIAKSNLCLLPGSKELMNILSKNWDIYVISTSYTHFARTVTKALNIKKDHVYCTELNISKLKRDLLDIEKYINVLVREIYQKYLENNKNLDFVLDDLNSFFWSKNENHYIKTMNQVTVRGGKRKEQALEEISEKTGINISEMIATGDSITDIDLLQRISKEQGIAISFNGNRFSVKKANLAITSPSNLGVLPVFESKEKEKFQEFLLEWESKFNDFKTDPKNISNGLISKQCKAFFVQYNFVPEIINLTNKSEEELKNIVFRQEEMRKIVRGWAGNLG